MNILVFLAAFAFMEFVAWFTHKYVMHGFLWVLHLDHHIKPDEHTAFFEKNDWFFLIFAIPAMVLIIAGLVSALIPLVSAGAGITLYGLTYFTVHEVIIHGRLPLRIPVRGKYMTSLIKAHQAHHMPGNKDDFMSFGLLVFPSRFLKQQ